MTHERESGKTIILAVAMVYTKESWQKSSIRIKWRDIDPNEEEGG